MLAALTAVGMSAASCAFAVYPDRPIKMIIGYAAGGGTDTVARILAEGLSTILAQSVVVENVTGGSGAIATQRVIGAVPDGYTIQLAASTEIVINPLITPNLPYDAERGLRPIALIGTLPSVLVGKKDLVPDSLDELVVYLRSVSAPASVGTPGVGTPQHITLELFKVKAGIGRLLLVPYKGGAPAFADVLGGHLDLAMMTLPAVLPHLRTNKFKVYGVTTLARAPTAPEIPAFSEFQGFAGFEFVTWFGAFAPANTPDAIVIQLQNAILDTLKEPKIRGRFEREAVTVTAGDRQVLDSRVRDERRELQPIVKAADIKSTN